MIDIPSGWAAVLVAMVGIVPTTLSVITVVLGQRTRKDAAVARHELQNNSGSSTKDAIDRIETKLTNDYHRLGTLDRRVTTIGAGLVGLAALIAAPTIRHLTKKARHHG